MPVDAMERICVNMVILDLIFMLSLGMIKSQQTDKSVIVASEVVF